MNGSTTLGAYMKDFKTVLSEWKHYQRHKLNYKMANNYRCNLNFHLNGVPEVWQNATLTFITEPGEPRLQFRHQSGIVSHKLRIPLTDLNGYNTEGGIIEIIVNPERNVGLITIEFPTEAVHELALARLQACTRDMPSSESSRKNYRTCTCDIRPMKAVKMTKT